jgi:hypothetical protein
VLPAAVDAQTASEPSAAAAASPRQLGLPEFSVVFVCVFQLPVHSLQPHFACIQLSGQFCLLVLLARVHICGSLQLCFGGLLLHLLQLVSQTPSGFKPSVPAGIVLENKHVSCIICPSSARLFTHSFEGLLCFFKASANSYQFFIDCCHSHFLKNEEAHFLQTFFI